MNISVVDNVNSEMKRFGMSQEDLCEKLQIGRKTFYAWKKKGDMPVSKLLECARIFNCTLDYFARDVKIGESIETKSA